MQRFALSGSVLTTCRVALVHVQAPPWQLSPEGQPQSPQQVVCVSVPLQMPSPQTGVATQVVPLQVWFDGQPQSWQQVD